MTDKDWITVAHILIAIVVGVLIVDLFFTVLMEIAQ